MTLQQPTGDSSAVGEIVDFVEDQLLEGVDVEHKPLWLPNPEADGRKNPQQLAIASEADELFYGGAAGGGKTDLLLGLAFTQHKRSVVFRRLYSQLSAVVDRSEEIAEERGRLNKVDKRWLLPGQTLDFGAMQYERDKKKWQGQPHDFYGFDEITEYTRTQYLFVITWNRTTIPGQRCRVVVAGNPPIDEAGSWVIEEWAPWLDDTYHDPAAPGELRWYVRDGHHLIWSKTSDPILVAGNPRLSRSRTFIPAKLADNPYLNRDSKYRAVLESLPDELRSAFLEGDFSASKAVNPWQVIPTAWVRQAQQRWEEMDEPETPVSGMGFDVARGGSDQTAIGWRRGGWFNVHSWAGKETQDGPAAAMKVKEVIDAKGMPPYVNIDVIGIGSSAYDTTSAMYHGKSKIAPVNAASGSEYTDRSGALRMRNKRAEYYWRLRDGLDPEYGDQLALPSGNEVLADLCAATYSVQAGGVVLIEPKEKIKERIGRSPDLGEAIMLANLPPDIAPPPASADAEFDLSIYRDRKASRSLGIRRRRRR